MPKYKAACEVPSVVKDYLFNLMVSNKIEQVEIEFSGSGDDGAVDGAILYPQNISDVGDDLVTIPEEVFKAFENVQYKIYCHGNLNTTFPIKEIFCMILDPWIQDVPVDWVNGDGGAGSCELIIKKNKLEINISAYEWVREEGPNHTCKL